jgi:hypothetical protein
MLFNQLQRHGGIHQIDLMIKNNPQAFENTKTLINDETLDGRLQHAVDHPDSPLTAALIVELEAIVSKVKGKLPYSLDSRKAKKGDFIAFGRPFGLPGFFNTFNPDPTGSCPALRHTYLSINNSDFPATDPNDSFKSAIQNETPFTGPSDQFGNNFPSLDPKPETLLQRMTADGVSAAEIFRMDLCGWFAHLYGITQANVTRKTSVLKRGVYGYCSALASVNEVTVNGWMHNHMLAWTGIPSFVRVFATGTPQLAESLHNYLDTVQQCHLPEAFHVESLLRRVNGLPPYHASWYRFPRFVDNPDAFDMCVFRQADRTQIHAIHLARCRKGVWGKNQCSLGFEKPLREVTGTDCLYRIDEEEGEGEENDAAEVDADEGMAGQNHTPVTTQIALVKE